MLVMELHFFERLTVTNPPLFLNKRLHFGGAFRGFPLLRRMAIIPVCSWALSIHFVELVVTSRHIPPTSDRFENHAQLAHRDALHGVSLAGSGLCPFPGNILVPTDLGFAQFPLHCA